MSRTPKERWTCLKGLREGTAFLASNLHRQGQTHAAVVVGRQSIEIGTTALEAYRMVDKSEKVDCQYTLDHRWRTYDTLSLSLLATGDREVSHNPRSDQS